MNITCKKITRPATNLLETFNRVTTPEVSNLLKRSANKQCLLDPIPTWLLKKVTDVLSPVIAAMCNTSIQHQTFPSSHKNAIVNPLLKKSTLNPNDLASYRPISNLSFVSKTLERLINNRLSTHMDSQSMLPSTQSGYRTNYSTETALVRIHNDIVNAVDCGLISGLVLLDLSAAFDTVNHAVLQEVLSDRFGVAGGALSWLTSYLEGRTQTIRVGTSQSTIRDLVCGIPQGSVLGPKQFIVYVEDVDNVFTGNQIAYHGYADDMQGLKSCPPTQLNYIVDSFRKNVIDVSNWCSSRGLQLNTKKTELIWFGSPSNLRSLAQDDAKITVGSTTIEPVNVVRDLGFYFDSELSMRDHISRTTKSCFYQLRRLRPIRRQLGCDVTKCLVCSFVLSRLDYCNALLAGLPTNTLKPLQRVQNAAARLVLGLKWSDHITPALMELHWLPIKQRIEYKLAILVYKCLHHQAPNYLTELFNSIADIQPRSSLRSASDGKLDIPRTKLQFGERAFAVAGARQWNSLPAQLRSIEDFTLFKSKLKTHLFNLAFNHCF